MKILFSLTVLIFTATFTATAQRVFDEHGYIISNSGVARAPQHAAGIAPAGSPGAGSTGSGNAGILSAGHDVAWLPMGAGQWAEVYQSTKVGGELYTLQNGVDPSGTYRCGISRWDGVQWVEVGAFDWTSRGILFTGYNGDLYTEMTTRNQYMGMSRWNGKQWTTIKTLGTVSPISLMVGLVFQGELYVGGWTNETTGGHNIARWNGKQWNTVGEGIDNRDGLAGAGPDNTQVVALAEFHGKLYAGGRFSHAGGLHSPYLAAWNGTSWEAMPTAPATSVEEMCVLNDTLFLYCRTRTSSAPGMVAAWDGTQLRYLPSPPFSWVSDMCTYNGAVYVSGKMSGGSSVARWNGSAWETFQGFASAPSDSTDAYTGCLIEHEGVLVAGGRFRSFKGTQLSYIARLCNEGDCGAIAGTVFNDGDGECTLGSKDSVLPHRMVMIEPGPIYAASDALGRYLLPALPGDYTVSVQPPLHWIQTCPAAPGAHAAHITGGDDHLLGIDFAMKPEPNVRDLRVGLTGDRARPGGVIDYYITYENIGTETVSGTVTFTYDPRLTVAGSTPQADRSNAATLEWEFTGLVVDESRTIHVVLNVPTTIATNETLCAYVSVDFAGSPVYTFNSDDRDSVCVQVVNSHDPNDISVFPNGLEYNGEISRDDSVLSYTIRFQNTGNAQAYRVIVVDTLSRYLDPASVRPGTASHPCTMSISGPGVLTWTFENINLADDKSDEPASHGLLKYFVHVRPNLPVGTAIGNGAHIYFDYNAPVATNTVVSTIAGPLSVERAPAAAELQPVPNPSAGLVHVSGRLRSGAGIDVLDVLGNRLLRIPVGDAESQTLDLRGLPAGLYLLALPGIEGTTIRRVIVEH